MSTPKLSKYGWIQISLQKPLKLAGFTSNLITFSGFTYFSVGYAVGFPSFSSLGRESLLVSRLSYLLRSLSLNRALLSFALSNRLELEVKGTQWRP